MFNQLSTPKIQILKTTDLGFLFSTIKNTINKVKELKNWKKSICKYKGLSKEMLEIGVKRDQNSTENGCVQEGQEWWARGHCLGHPVQGRWQPR